MEGTSCNPKPPLQRWPYTRRPDGRIAVTLDNNAWDFLLEKMINLANKLPTDQFALFVPRQVEIESSAIDVGVRRFVQRLAIGAKLLGRTVRNLIRRCRQLLTGQGKASSV